MKRFLVVNLVLVALAGWTAADAVAGNPAYYHPPGQSRGISEILMHHGGYSNTSSAYYRPAGQSRGISEILMNRGGHSYSGNGYRSNHAHPGNYQNQRLPWGP